MVALTLLFMYIARFKCREKVERDFKGSLFATQPSTAGYIDRPKLSRELRVCTDI